MNTSGHNRSDSGEAEGDRRTGDDPYSGLAVTAMKSSGVASCTDVEQDKITTERGSGGAAWDKSDLDPASAGGESIITRAGMKLWVNKGSIGRIEKSGASPGTYMYTMLLRDFNGLIVPPHRGTHSTEHGYSFSRKKTQMCYW